MSRNNLGISTHELQENTGRLSGLVASWLNNGDTIESYESELHDIVLDIVYVLSDIGKDVGLVISVKEDV